ncbi:uncharacterized protein M421DRAFT_182737 [Didymella exigua CBS 183.55]|uniref:Arrestin-like N-terminal domain-containing protein n=1 Tax=Didymella exigua CBS 183.55 TaxID=1150837 RepID=A0A6A5RH97_9PLEO|nr:uncharacterized protein M421DRAFT_182737 [Didymella exigua CBS 183.55]KAF1927142.1 hypothetical protein M421DRAFT_182737 [Didymella exigua CBS 183.55]
MNVMGKPRLALQVPADHIIVITADGASDSLLHGTLIFSNVPLQCDIQITLARVGRLKRGKDMENDSASKKLMSELRFMRSHKEQKRELFNYEMAEKLCGCFVSPLRGTPTSKTTKCDFVLQIPSYLPATAALPSVDISYAIFATCNLANGEVLQTSQDLRIIREIAGPIRLEPSRTVSFPETTFAICASFGLPSSNHKNSTISATLQLNGLNLPITNSMRVNEMRWLVPREIRWYLEETTVLITGCPDATGHLPMSTAQRVLKKRQIATGKEKLKLNYPFTRAGNTPITMCPDNSSISILFMILAPKDISLGESTALAVAGGHVLHTVLDKYAGNLHGLQKRFAVYLEYKLHVWLRIGEDIFDEASGDLVNRKMDEMAYTVVCPLIQQRTRDDEYTQDQSAQFIPPSYDGIWEQPPPDYSMPPEYATIEERRPSTWHTAEASTSLSS